MSFITDNVDFQICVKLRISWHIRCIHEVKNLVLDIWRQPLRVGALADRLVHLIAMECLYIQGLSILDTVFRMASLCYIFLSGEK